jgi:molecular chaperone DnaJ
MVVSRTCGHCGGAGESIPHPCTECSGQGQVAREREIAIKIPAGVDTGSRMRLAGEGEAGQLGGPPGDLYVVLQVEEHPFFKRHDDDIFCEIPITFPQAALGAEVKVPTIDGWEKLQIPEGTQTGTIFKIKGKGISRLRGHGRGNQIVTVTVVTPKRLDKHERRLFRQLQESIPAITVDPEAPAKDKSFIEKLFG